MPHRISDAQVPAQQREFASRPSLSTLMSINALFLRLGLPCRREMAANEHETPPLREKDHKAARFAAHCSRTRRASYGYRQVHRIRKRKRMMRASTERQTERRDQAGLDRRYGKIGISAVAAAVQYQSDCKNHAYAPSNVAPQGDHDDA
jgi:hypothetical protein